MTINVQPDIRDQKLWDDTLMDFHWPEESEAAYWESATFQYKTYRTAMEAQRALSRGVAAARDVPGTEVATVVLDLDRFVEPLESDAARHLGNAVACALMGLAVRDFKLQLNDIHARHVNEFRMLKAHPERRETLNYEPSTHIGSAMAHYRETYERLNKALNASMLPIPLTDTAHLADVIDPELYAVITAAADIYTQINA